MRSDQKNLVDGCAGENVAFGVMDNCPLAARQNLLRPATDHRAFTRTLIADNEDVGGFRDGRELNVRRKPE